MAFVLHEEAEKNFNKIAYELVEAIDEKELVREQPKALKGSMKDRKTQDLTGRLADVPFISSSLYNFNRIDRYSEYKGITTGLKEEHYHKYEKLVKSIFVKKAVSDIATHEFIYDHTFDWIINTFKNKKAETNLVAYLQGKVLESSRNYRFYFKVLNLDIEKEFNIGDVSFGWITPDFFNKVSNGKESLQNRFLGSVFASYELKNVVKDRGVQIAEKECIKAINILKLFTPTIKVPDYTTTFDIDSRVSIYRENQYIVQDTDDDKGMFISFRANGKSNEFKEDTINLLIECSENFIKLIRLKEPNEIQRLLLKALQKFSEAISSRDLHRRLVDLFTLQESLLLKNDTVNSRDSLIFFGEKLFKNPEDSLEVFAKRIMRLYDVRSKIVHHDDKSEFSIDDLTSIQHQCVILMENCIKGSFLFQTKLELLADVERVSAMTIEQYTFNRIKNDNTSLEVD